jgi:hypothetical protein
VVREGVGAGERNEPSLVCTYEKKKKCAKCILMNVCDPVLHIAVA